MEAVVRERYGGPETLEIKQVTAPRPAAGEVSIQVMAASLNAADVHLLRGSPPPMRLVFGLFRPKTHALGADVAGRVLEVGEGVTELRPGDRVFGDLSEAGFGAFAQQVAAPVSALAHIPEGVSYQAAAASGMAAVTALQALKGTGGTQGPGPGDRVLVTGASGGVGSFTVQVAKAYGAHVTAVTSTPNVSAVKALGADVVLDRHATDFRNGEARFDLIVEAGGYGPVRPTLRLLRAGGRYVFVGGGGPATFSALVLGKAMLAKPAKADLEEVARLLREGNIEPLIGANFPLNRSAEAVELFESGKSQGKIIFRIGEGDAQLPSASTAEPGGAAPEPSEAAD